MNGIDVFLLVFVRLTGLFVTAPIFGRRNIPSVFKVGFAFMMTLVLFSGMTVKYSLSSDNIYSYAGMIAKEFMVGLTLGYVAYLIFTAIYFGGQIIDMQIGFGMVNVLDPISNIQVPITSNFYFILAMLSFIISNGHHMLITAIFESYKTVPIGTAVFGANLLNDILRMSQNVFVLGFKIAAPVLVAILVTDILLGILTKTVPQLNVFVVGMPLKIFIGLMVMLFTVATLMGFVDFLINGMNLDVAHFLRSMVQK